MGQILHGRFLFSKELCFLVDSLSCFCKLSFIPEIQGVCDCCSAQERILLKELKLSKVKAAMFMAF